MHWSVSLCMGVAEGASGASADTPGVGLKLVSVSFSHEKKGIWGILIERLLVRLQNIKNEKLKAKLVETLHKLQKRLQDLQDRIKESKDKNAVKSFTLPYSLIEDIKEVINQIKNQGGNIIDTAGNIKDILEKIFG